MDDLVSARRRPAVPPSQRRLELVRAAAVRAHHDPAQLAVRLDVDDAQVGEGRHERAAQAPHGLLERRRAVRHLGHAGQQLKARAADDQPVRRGGGQDGEARPQDDDARPGPGSPPSRSSRSRPGSPGNTSTASAPTAAVWRVVPHSAVRNGAMTTVELKLRRSPHPASSPTSSEAQRGARQQRPQVPRRATADGGPGGRASAATGGAP